MGQMARSQETLRRLAMIDEGFVEDQAGFGLGLAGISALDPKTAALLQVGVPTAFGSPTVCLEWSAGRVVAAAPEVATALGYGGMLDVRPGRMPRQRQGEFCAAPSSMSR